MPVVSGAPDPGQITRAPTKGLAWLKLGRRCHTMCMRSVEWG
jgi:hypothetical protein